MQFSLVAAGLLALALPAIARDCNRGASAGTANGECVHYYKNGDCNGGGELGSYAPTCGGNCFQYNSFNSLKAVGDGTYGTDCHAYSDDNCQNQLADTGNQKISKCVSVQGAKSMKCYYRC